MAQQLPVASASTGLVSCQTHRTATLGLPCLYTTDDNDDDDDDDDGS